MTQGELEKIPQEIVRTMSQLETRIMEDMVHRIRINGFSTAAADWQFTRLQQLGMSEKQIKDWVRETLEVSEKEIEKIYSDDTYQEYMRHKRAYDAYGRSQIPFEENAELRQLIEAVTRQTMEELENITRTMGIVHSGSSGSVQPMTLTEYYRKTLDDAMYDIQSGAFDYNTVLKRTVEDMTTSGIRWIDYDSGRHNRIPVASRRAVMTGFRQVQGKINEQTAKDLGTDSYEVTVHIGARPTHQVWEGKVWTMEQLQSVCGLGTVTGLHGANCYHDYNAFVPGVSVRTYTDDQLDQIHQEENTPKTYNGKEYTTYEALQRQRKLETRARKYREDVHLLEKGGGSEDDIIAKKCQYQKTLQEYRAFSDKMDLPMQKERIYQDGLKVDMKAPKQLLKNKGEVRERKIHFGALESFEVERGTIKVRKVTNKGYNNLYLAADVILSPRELRRLNNQISEAKDLLGISDRIASRIVIVEDTSTLASYNPRLDTLYINKRLADEKEIVKLQAGFACPDNPNSTIVHELYHWKDAEEYRIKVGGIQEAGPHSAYSVYQRRRAREQLEKAGIDLSSAQSVFAISPYAFDAWIDNNLEEVYTEFRTKRLLEEGGKA